MVNIFTRLAQYVSSSWHTTSTKSNPTYTVEFQSQGGASLPQRMSNDFKAYAKEGYRRNDTVHKCISYIARNGAGVEWGLYTDKTCQKEVTNHELLDRWANPNPEQYTFDFVEAWLSYYLLDGNSFVKGISAFGKNPKAKPDELYVLRPDYVHVIPSDTGVAGYVYGSDSSTGTFTPKEAIMHAKYWCPDDLLRGLSPLEIAAIFVDQQKYGNEWNLAYMKNAMNMPGFWKTDQLLTQIDFGKLKRDLKEKYAGYKNAGAAPLLDGGVSWQETSKPPLELDWLNSAMRNNIYIANIYNLAPDLVGDTSASTYNNKKEAKYASYTEAIFPALDKLMAGLNRWFVPRYGKGLYLAYKKESVETIQEIIQEQLKTKSDRSTKIWMSGKCTLDEARELEGLPPIPKGMGKVYRFGAVLVREEDLGTYAEQSIAEPAAPPVPQAEPLNVPQPAPGGGTPTNDTSTQPGKEGQNSNGKKPTNKPHEPIPPKKPQSQDSKKSLDEKATWVDPTVESRLQDYADRQVTHLRWVCDGNPCSLCIQNADVMVEVGDAFPSGDVLPQVHFGCQCKVIEISAPQFGMMRRHTTHVQHADLSFAEALDRLDMEASDSRKEQELPQGDDDLRQVKRRRGRDEYRAFMEKTLT
jgi:HK97 family phage portal protein